MEVTDPKELKRLIAQERRSQKAGHRSFVEISETVLPREYWNVLDEMGNNSIRDAIRWDKKINAFEPSEHEGSIKKLTRFQR